MRRIHSWHWVQEQVARATESWNLCPTQSSLAGPTHSAGDQRKREQAYDEALQAAEREARRAPRNRAQRLKAQDRITAAFARFSAVALGLEDDAIHLLTDDFLPVGTKLAQWARRFDPSLAMPEIVQACRNAWTACGLQPLLGEPIALTPSILGYSLLYPYSDNYLDGDGVSARQKLQFSERFRERLKGALSEPLDRREAALWSLVALIEEQFPRQRYPQVFDCLLAIHRAQEDSVAQQRRFDDCRDDGILRISCAKGGSSVAADACLARGWLDEEESGFAFDWGMLLQLGDDLQDVQEDIRNGSTTLFSRAAAFGEPLDGLTTRLLNFSNVVSDRMDQLPHGSAMLKGLLRMSWRSLILMAVAQSHEFFNPEFLVEAERHSPFRFGFLRARRDRLTGRQGLYATLFEAFLEPSDGYEEISLASAEQARYVPQPAVHPVADPTAL
jgi:hypothetical protein